jgi:predicted metal-dependent enzyme (double-stranded beta helix superfamily)
LGKAIENSISTPGNWCYNKLKSKENEFGDDPKMTYLRITLGQNNGESPGVAYVMEIWPPGHYSPVHSHAGANAIIKVLRGKINVSLYPFLNNTVPPFANQTFEKNSITWISPTLNQVHKLKNNEKKTCVTIQCYMYPEEDTSHYDYFDYIDTSGNEMKYTPDSDCSFLEFVGLMKKEFKSLF